MKPTLRILMLATVAAGLALAAYGLTRHFLCRGAGHAAPASATPWPMAHDAAWLTKKLALTPEQSAAVQALDQDYRRRLTDLCAVHCETRAKLRDVIFNPQATPEQTRALLEKMAEVQTQTDLATLEHLRNIYRKLTPAQQKVFADWVTPCICDNCPTGMHPCPTGQEKGTEAHPPMTMKETP